MRRPALLAACLLCAAGLRAGRWGLDLGPVLGVGMANFAGTPSGLKPPSDPSNLFALYPPGVSAVNEVGLTGMAGLEARLTRGRRWDLDLQALYHGASVSMREALRYPSGTALDRQTTWEWSGLLLPLELGWTLPLLRGGGGVLGLRLAGGLWYASAQARRKNLASGISALERPWPGAPPDDWGPLAGLGLEWVNGKGRRTAGFQVRARLGRAHPDDAAGADQALWMLEGVLSVPVWMKVL